MRLFTLSTVLGWCENRDLGINLFMLILVYFADKNREIPKALLRIW
jgi:hypothetical protein